MAPLPILPATLNSITSLAHDLPKRLPHPHLPSRSLEPATTTATARSLPARVAAVLRRQQTSAIIPTGYGNINNSSSPGTIVGIVLGSVFGFLLILYLIYTCLNFNAPSSSSSAYTESVAVRDRRKSHGSTRTRSRRASETVEIRRERSPIRVVVPERVVVEERRETRRERSRGGSDEVVVIEEHSPPPRRSKSKRERREREGSEVRDSGFRTVDPASFGGVVGGRRSSGRRGSGR